jgi:hypothetical protein
VAKDKKKKKKDKKSKSAVGTAASGLKALSRNPMVADIVAAALVATASALKDSKKAQRLAADAGDELTKLSKEGARRGGILWDMALQIGRESLDALAGESRAKPAKAKPRAKRAPAKRKPAAPSATPRSTTKKAK